MSISKDLFLAILSMDSYNRGYGAGISDAGENDQDGLGNASDGSIKIGNASISFNLEDAEIAEQAQAAGFYAVAYEVEAGAWDGMNEKTTVISYRGTDFSPDPGFLDDVRDGWSFGTGCLGANPCIASTCERLSAWRI